MAIKTDSSANVVDGNFEKATAFLNIDIEDSEGAFKSFGGVPLKSSEAMHNALIEAFDNGLNPDDLIIRVRFHKLGDKPKGFMPKLKAK